VAFAFMVGSAAACANLDGLSGGHRDAGAPDSGSIGDGGVTGDGSLTGDGVTVSPATLDFSYDCNQQKTGSFAIANTSKAPLDFTVNLPSSEAFVVEETDAGSLSGTLPPGGIKVITVIAQSGTAGEIAGDILIHAGDSDLLVHTTGARHGAALVVNPVTIDFGIVHSGAIANLPVSFTNPGDTAVTVPTLILTDFTLASAMVAPGATVTANALMKAGASGQPLTENAPLTINGVSLCPGSTTALSFTGQRSDANVTVNPAKLDFGPIDCNTTSTKTLAATISSYDLAAVTNWGASLGKGSGSPFKIVGPASGQLAKAANLNTPTTATITVGLNTAGATPSTITDTLTVTGGASPIVVTLSMTVSGAVLTVQPTDLTFTRSGASATAAIKNTGNAATCAAYTLTSSDPTAWKIETGDPYAAGGSNGCGISFRPPLGASAATVYSGTIAITQTSCGSGSPSAPFCVPPPVITISGTNSGGH
jgi:hypothetical protein